MMRNCAIQTSRKTERENIRGCETQQNFINQVRNKNRQQIVLSYKMRNVRYLDLLQVSVRFVVLPHAMEMGSERWDERFRVIVCSMNPNGSSTTNNRTAQRQQRSTPKQIVRGTNRHPMWNRRVAISFDWRYEPVVVVCPFDSIQRAESVSANHRPILWLPRMEQPDK